MKRLSLMLLSLVLPCGCESKMFQTQVQKDEERKTLQTTPDPKQPNLFVAAPNSSLAQL
jgi:hypothetical protein